MMWKRRISPVAVLMPVLLILGACSAGTPAPSAEATITEQEDEKALTAVATTNMIADVVGRVGGDMVVVTGLIPTGADPHSFTPTPRDLAGIAEADVVFVNGLGLEEAMTPMLDNVQGELPIVTVNQGLDPLAVDDDDADHDEDGHGDEGHEADEHGAEAHETDEHGAEAHGHDHHGDDPHTWFDIDNVMHWVEVIEQTLSELDPDHAALYAENSAAYLAELDALAAELDALLAQLPADQRKLVTDHDSLGYFAHRYDFRIIGTVVPALSTLATPSAQQLAALQDQIATEQVQALFVGSTVNPDLAAQLAEDMGVPVVVIYTGSLSDEDGPAGTYLDFMRYNVAAIVEALQ